MTSNYWNEIKRGLIALAIAIIAMSLFGCRSEKHITTDTHVRDSVRIEARTIYDTLRVCVYDTTSIESERTSKTEASITLTDGTYDTRTGVITGITGINVRNEASEWLRMIDAQRAELERVRAERDSIAESTHAQDDASREDVKPRSVWNEITNAITLMLIIIVTTIAAWYIITKRK